MSAALRTSAVLIGFAALLATVKAVAILVTGNQPPAVFESIGLPLGLGLVMLARSHSGHLPKLAMFGAALGGLAGAASVVGLVTLVANAHPDDAVESMLAVCAGFGPPFAMLCIGRSLRHCDERLRLIGRRAVVAGALVVPFLVVGGVLADLFSERYLEVGLLLVAGTWMWIAQGAWKAAEVVD